MLVDFLFVDILFAPTVDSNKQTLPAKLNTHRPSNEQQLEKDVTMQVQPSTNVSTRLTRVNSSNRFKRGTMLTLNKIQSGNFDLETTRVLPSATLEAHDLAKLSVKNILEDRVAAIKKTLLRQETQRRTSTKRSVSFKKNIPLPEMSPDDQFVDLTIDISEQRKELKRNQQDKFDEMWG